MRTLAKIISRIFDPVILIPLILVVVVWFAYVNGYRWQFVALIFVIDAVCPGVAFLVQQSKSGFKDWDIHDRKARIPLFIATLFFHGLGVVVAFGLGQILVAQILLGLWMLAIVYAIVTVYWKVSVHAGVNATIATLLLLFGGWQFWWVWLIVVLVAWSRVVDKDHTVQQVLVG